MFAIYSQSSAKVENLNVATETASDQIRNATEWMIVETELTKKTAVSTSSIFISYSFWNRSHLKFRLFSLYFEILKNEIVNIFSKKN